MKRLIVYMPSEDISFIGDITFPKLGKVRLCGEAIKDDVEYIVYAHVSLAAKRGSHWCKEQFRQGNTVEIKTAY